MLTSEKGARAAPSLCGLNLIQVSESGPSLTSPLTQNMDGARRPFSLPEEAKTSKRDKYNPTRCSERTFGS